MNTRSRSTSIKILSLLLSVVLLTSLQVTGVPSPAVAASGYTLAGDVVGWGDNLFGQLDIPEGLSDVIAVAAGDFHSLALKSDGTVVAWGCEGPYWGAYFFLTYDADGQCDVPEGLSDVVAIAAGARSSLALKSDGTVVGWGAFGSPPDEQFMAVDAGPSANWGVTTSGNVLYWGDNNWNGVGYGDYPADSSDIIDVAAAEGGAFGLKSDGTTVAWGEAGIFMYFGETIYLRAPPDGWENVVDISGGLFTSLALKSDGTVQFTCTEDFACYNYPVGLSGVTAIHAGQAHGLALKDDGTVVAWGCGGVDWTGQPMTDFGQCDVPDGLSRVSFISAGSAHNLAVLGHYGFTGFEPPVDNPDVVNIVKAGQMVPVRWSLQDVRGVPVSEVDSVEVTVEDYSCDAAAGENLVVEDAIDGSGFQNLGNGHYKFNWRTPTSYAHSCKQLNLDLGDGLVHTALFEFR